MTDLIRPAILEIKPYEPGKPIEEVEREIGISGVIKMASNENPFGPSPDAVAAMREVLEKIHLYPDGNCFYLKQGLSAHLRVPEASLIIGNGSDEILKFLAEAFLNEGEETIMAVPSFSEYVFVTQLMAGCLIRVPSRNFKHDLAAMAERVGPRTKLIFICNPNNPTGTIVTRAEIEAFLDRLPEQVVVVFDEAYHEYVMDEAYPDTLDYIKQGRPNVITLRTFSKIYGLAGLRIGYGVAAPALISWLMRVREPFNVNMLAQVGALAALNDACHVSCTRKMNNEGKDYLYQQFTEMNLTYVPTEANFMLVNVQQDARSVFKRLLAEGVIVRSGDIFGLPEYLRVTIGTTGQNMRFIEALKKVL